ncbi:MAG: lytic transglycosylase domain-containing protein, partial [Clostridia bacterium]|nr:lytic transglycosylase domain-containing protein [Clostridia bacterium]
MKKILYKILTVLLCAFWGFYALLGMANCVAKKYLYPLKNQQTVFEFADVYGLERALVFAVIKVESGFDENAESRAGAIGLMQITPDTAKYIADLQGIEKYDLKDQRTNVNFGCFYIKYLMQKFKNADTAMVAYNAGEGNVSLWLMNPEYSDDRITLKYIPFPESREYIKK